MPAVPAAAVALQQAEIRNDNGRRMADAQSAGAIFRIDPVGVSFVLPGPSCVSRSMATGAPVIDNTGLTGEWDVDLKFELDASGAQGGAEPRYGSIFTAVREQLGLKLEPTKSSVDMLVIEQIERPSPN